MSDVVSFHYLAPAPNKSVSLDLLSVAASTLFLEEAQIAVTQFLSTVLSMKEKYRERHKQCAANVK